MLLAVLAHKVLTPSTKSPNVSVNLSNKTNCMSANLADERHTNKLYNFKINFIMRYCITRE